MKCPNCGKDIEPGTFFCPKCLEEIPWVPEYHTMETIQNQNEYKKDKRIEKMKCHIRQRYLKKKRKKKIILTASIFLVILFGAYVAGYNFFNNYHSYGYQYQEAEKYYDKENYDKALEHIDRAIALEDMHEEAYRLLSEILVARKDVTGAIKVIEACLSDFPESEILYGELISLYEREGCPQKIKDLLDSCKSSKVRKAFSVYITPDPKINYGTGRYRANLDIKLYGSGVTFYYTLDGSEPDKNSKKYEEPISVGKGVTELKVIAYNRLGIPSDVIYRRYTIS